MSVIVRTKQWGNSIGIVIPRDKVESLKIRPNQDIMISIENKENVLKELFGLLKTKKTSEEILKEVRKDLKGKWLNV